MIDHDKLEFLWVQKYRPHKIDDCILPTALKADFAAMTEKDRLPSLLLSGSPGTGKTTVARALCEEIGADWIIINASNESGIDTLRVKISQYASTVSFSGAKKVVILDEADALTGAAQGALRAFVEDVSKNCGFILTCNYKNKIIPALQSRFTPIDFKIQSSEKPKLAAQFMKRAEIILENEGIEFDKRVIAELIQKHFPDFRRILNELQRYSSTGKIDTGILTNMSSDSFSELVRLLKTRKFVDVRKWVSQNSDTDPAKLFKDFYDHSLEMFDPKCIPEIILILAKYGYQDAFVIDKEINIMAAFVEIMREAVWK